MKLREQAMDAGSPGPLNRPLPRERPEDLAARVYAPLRAKETVLVTPSPQLLSLFRAYLRWYVGRHFHALRIAHPGRFPRQAEALVVYANHASWWDPLSFFLTSHYFLPQASHYGPMDAQALKHYGFLRRLGLFAVENGTRRGAVQFLRAGQEVLSRPNSVLWVTPEGKFTDVRTRPAVFRPGLAALCSRLGSLTLLPLAAEYTFWDERLPEMLLCCGRPIQMVGQYNAEDWSRRLAAALADTQDELAALARQRDAALFTTILAGRVGVSGVYDGWKRVTALLAGRAYQGSHGSIHHRSAP